MHTHVYNVKEMYSNPYFKLGLGGGRGTLACQAQSMQGLCHAHTCAQKHTHTKGETSLSPLRTEEANSLNPDLIHLSNLS